ncbi:MAG: amino acid permease [Verrucomicrobiae bacterium]|nr:amino acid permease [Verrucomicrobiae bacterium]
MSDSIDIHDDVKLLHRMGYAQELKRRMSAFSNFAISFSIICILAGGITSFQLGFCGAGGAGVGIGWPVGVFFAFLVSLTMAQVASAYPTAGGLYHWSSILGGKGWGWVTAWLNLSGLIFVTAAVDVGAYTIFINAVLPYFGVDPAGLTAHHQLLGVSLIIFSHALFNHYGIHVTTLLTDFSGYLIFAVSIVLTLTMLFLASHLDFGRLVTFANYSGDAGGGVWPQNNSIMMLFLLGLLLPVYTITGYDASAHTSEETVGAAKNVPKGILRSVYLSGIFGFVMVASFVLAIPNMDEAAKQGGNVFYWLMNTLVPEPLKMILWAGIALANYLCGLACLTSSSRMTFAFARDGGLPWSKGLRHISPVHRTPTYAIWITGTLAVLSTAYAEAYATLTAACVIFLYFSYVMPAAAGIFAYGRTWTRMGPFDIGKTAYRIIGVICVLGVLLMFYLGIQPPNEKALNITGIVIVLLIVTWFTVVKKRFKGPPSEEEAQARLEKLQELEQRVGEAGMKL